MGTIFILLAFLAPSGTKTNSDLSIDQLRSIQSISTNEDQLKLIQNNLNQLKLIKFKSIQINLNQFKSIQINPISSNQFKSV